MLFVLVVALCAAAKCKARKPVVVMHGTTSAQLNAQATLSPDLSLPAQCPHSFGPTMVWVDARELRPNVTQCVIEILKTQWHPETRLVESLDDCPSGTRTSRRPTALTRSAPTASPS